MIQQAIAQHAPTAVDYIAPGGSGLVGLLGGGGLTWYFLQGKVRETVTAMLEDHNKVLAEKLKKYEDDQNRLERHVDDMRDEVKKEISKVADTVDKVAVAVGTIRDTVIRMEEREKEREKLRAAEGPRRRRSSN